jgi:hypothetical protein
MDIFERLKASAPAEWSSYVDYPFVRQMETGRFATGCIGTLSAEALAEFPVLAKTGPRPGSSPRVRHIWPKPEFSGIM